MNSPDQTSALLKDIFRFTPEFDETFPKAMHEVTKAIQHIDLGNDPVYKNKVQTVLVKLKERLHSKDFKDNRINYVRVVTTQRTVLDEPAEGQNAPQERECRGLMIYACFEGDFGWYDPLKKFGLTAFYSSDCLNTKYGLFSADIQQGGVGAPFSHPFAASSYYFFRIHSDETASGYTDTDLHRYMNDHQWEFIGSHIAGTTVEDHVMSFPETPAGRARHEALWALRRVELG